jgi:hypothetical protein
MPLFSSLLKCPPLAPRIGRPTSDDGTSEESYVSMFNFRESRYLTEEDSIIIDTWTEFLLVL